MTAPVNPPAFPSRVGFGHDGRGVTLRDYFAGQALAGHMAKDNVSPMDADVAAYVFYSIADAVLAERAKDGEA